MGPAATRSRQIARAHPVPSRSALDSVVTKRAAGGGGRNDAMCACGRRAARERCTDGDAVTARPSACYGLRNDAILQVICPTSQTISEKPQSCHADHLATLHGVVFDIVGTRAAEAFGATKRISNRSPVLPLFWHCDVMSFSSKTTVVALPATNRQ